MQGAKYATFLATFCFDRVDNDRGVAPGKLENQFFEVAYPRPEKQHRAV